MNDTCRDTLALLDDYVEHALPPSLRASVDGHLSKCPYCTEYIQMYRDTIRLCQAVAEPAEPLDTGDRPDAADALDEPAERLVEAIVRDLARPG